MYDTQKSIKATVEKNLLASRGEQMQRTRVRLRPKAEPDYAPLLRQQ